MVVVDDANGGACWILLCFGFFSLDAVSSTLSRLCLLEWSPLSWWWRLDFIMLLLCFTLPFLSRLLPIPSSIVDVVVAVVLGRLDAKCVGNEYRSEHSFGIRD